MTRPTQPERDRQWAREQIKQYKAVYSRYSNYAEALEAALGEFAKGAGVHVIVQARPKSIASFAEKIQRKKDKYRDPLMRMTDLCGGRVITQTRADVQVLSEFIEKHFDVDRENSVEIHERLKPTEFGYRSIHYIVQFRRGVFSAQDISEAMYPDSGCPMKAEIQIRTLVEHAWANFAHDRAYKSAFSLPAQWQRQLAVMAGMLEEVDQSFIHIQASLKTYEANYGAYLSEEQLQHEMEILETVLTHDPQNVKLAHRLGKLMITHGDWQKAIALFSKPKYLKSGYQPLLRDLGIALCHTHRADPKSPRYRRGQAYLAAACAEPYRDADALTSLAGSWKPLNDDHAHELYRRAFAVAPTDPYAVSNYVVYEIAHQRDIAPVQLMMPTINAAIQRSRDQADVGMNLPWAFYNLGLFYLLLNRLHDSLMAYAKGIELSSNYWMLETAFRLLEHLNVVKDKLPSFEWAQRLLLIGRATKAPNEAVLEKLKELASPGVSPIRGPVVMVTGGTATAFESEIRSYRKLLIEAFHDFEGTIISGGTQAGISGLVGDVQRAYPQTIRTIGYIPDLMPPRLRIDTRYTEIRQTQGKNFSPLEHLQSWVDLILAGIRPTQVKLIGINGGKISAVEYRIALAFGTSVAMVEGSGREATRLLQDKDWKATKTLISLPADPMTARAFIGAKSAGLAEKERQVIAKAFHEAHRRRKTSDDPALAEWDKLRESLKESNRQQADHIVTKLRQIGCSLHRANGRPVRLLRFTKKEVEIMAEMEHGRWNAERLLDGWQWSTERHIGRKTNPSIVAWSKLPEKVKEWDRTAVRAIPEFLSKMGMEIRRNRR